MKLQEHTRNQKRMYRIHKQEERIHDQELMIGKLQEENKQLKEDIKFCLRSIKQEMEMSKDERTRNEMSSCYEILKRWDK